jgi:hypothetical protein
MPFILRRSSRGHQVLEVISTPWERDARDQTWDERPIVNVQLSEAATGPFFRVVQLVLVFPGGEFAKYEIPWRDRRSLPVVEEELRVRLVAPASER